MCIKIAIEVHGRIGDANNDFNINIYYFIITKMIKTEVPQPEKLKSISGSTDTLDGFTEIEIPNTDEQKRERSSKNLSIILVSIFIGWLILFLGVTIYQIRSYRKIVLKKEMEKILDDELDFLDVEDKIYAKNAVIRRIDGSVISFIGIPYSTESNKIKEVKELETIETKVESFLKSNSPNLAEKYEDLEFEKISDNCYRKDYFRYNIQNSGTDCRLVVKTANISIGSSDNFGKCATTYYWIYNNPSKEETKIYSLGPYYGHHSVEVTEGLFDEPSGGRSYTLYGCQPPVGAYKTNEELKRMQTIIRENATITPYSQKSSNFASYQINLDKFAREEISKINQKIDELHFDAESVRDYTTLKEATSCIYSL